MIRIVNGFLYVGGFKAVELAEKFSTPLYVYDLEVVEERYRRFVEAFRYSDFEVLYACKANSNVEILKFLRDLGAGLDAVSPYEVLLGIRVGFKPEKILFTGSSVSDEEMRFVKELGVFVNVDSLSQLKRFGKMFPGSEVSIRVNPGFGAGHHEKVVTGGLTKFGVYLNQLGEAKKIAEDYRLRVVGLHTHVGSGIMDPDVFIRAAEILSRVAESMFREVEFIDIGGGFGVPYRRGEPELSIDAVGGAVSSIVEDLSRRLGRDLKLRVEPGRYLVAKAGILLVRVVDIKTVEAGGAKKIFIGVDSGMNHLIRPALYGAHHEVIHTTRADAGRRIVADIVGNICESGDILAKDVELPEVSEGDVLAIMDAGAYGYAMSSNYNLRPRPAEVVVYRDSAKLARRRETFEDLIRTFTEAI